MGARGDVWPLRLGGFTCERCRCASLMRRREQLLRAPVVGAFKPMSHLRSKLEPAPPNSVREDGGRLLGAHCDADLLPRREGDGGGWGREPGAPLLGCGAGLGHDVDAT